MGSVTAVDFSRVNIAWQYDPLAEIKIRCRAIEENNLTTVFFRIRAESISSWTYEFLLQDGYQSETHQELDGYKIDTLLNEVNQKIVGITFNKRNKNLLVLRISKPDIFYYHDTSLKNGSLSISPIYPVDGNGLPIFEEYLNSSNYSWKGSSSYFALQYKDNFQLADPPMADMKPLAPSIDLDSSYVFYDSAKFLENYFYIVRKDSNSTSGVTILREAVYYPEFRKLEELMESMLYIVNEPEKKALINSRNPKKSFDSFWINTYSTKFRARNAIRNYYNWVTQANQLFTDFKQGWKTDRGMLFITFGVPDEVYRSGNKEEWFYEQGPNFEFTIISTFFAPKTYALRRSQNLEEPWYENIAAIRRGINE
jgi:GWxTD domain-containing protein